MKLLSSFSALFLGKVVCDLWLAAVALVLISDEAILVNSQTLDIMTLKNRVIEVTKGLNEDALLEVSEDSNYTSYQSEAFLRLSQQVNVDAFTDAKIVQYYTLYCIYYATNAVANEITDNDIRFENITLPGWLVSTGWRDATNVDPCGVSTITLTSGTTETSIATTLSETVVAGWFGVVCDTGGRIVALELFSNLMTGEWPEEIVLLASDGPFSTGAGSLERLDLFDNEFLSNGGDSTWMSDLGSNMTTILVEKTGFSGDIPLLPENLVNFDIRNTFYTGGLTDASFALVTQLNYLNLDGCMFNTSIPSILSELPNLEYVYMSDNLLVGDLSPLEGSSAMKEFWADGNPDLTGPLYPWFGSITTLASLSLAYNNLTGTIPIELGNLTEMEQMWLQSNSLVGTVPTELGKMIKLRHLELESNAFTGFVHASICQKTEFPIQTLKFLGADCCNTNFFCPCCTCCNLDECVAGVIGSKIECPLL